MNCTDGPETDNPVPYHLNMSDEELIPGESSIQRMYLVKSVFKAPVPAYCLEHMSALSAQTAE